MTRSEEEKIFRDAVLESCESCEPRAEPPKEMEVKVFQNKKTGEKIYELNLGSFKKVFKSEEDLKIFLDKQYGKRNS